jgi:hypothetical protein
MTDHNHARDADRLTVEASRRLLERASELETARSTGPSVAELREAAMEAGIAPLAFEQALAEFRGTDPSFPVASAPARRRRLASFWPAALGFVGLLSLLMLRLLVPGT